MHIKRLLNFIPEKAPNEDTAKVRFRIKWNNSKNIVSFGLGIRVDPDKWSIETQRCKNNTTHGKEKIPSNVINKELQRVHDLAEDIFAYFENKETIPTIKEYKDAFNKKNGKVNNRYSDNNNKTFFEIFDEYIQQQGIVNSWSTSMITKFGTLKKHILNYCSNVSFADINEDFFIGFTRYLQSSRSMLLKFKDADCGMKNTTTARMIVIFKTFLRWAKKNDYYKGNVLDNFKPKFKGTDGNNKEVIHLTWDELKKLYNYKFEHDYQTKVRDVFCFCCFTSLRYSDVSKLKKTDIKNDCIFVVTQKTTDALKIELNKYSRAILEKYKDNGKENALPVPPIRNMNEGLREIGKIMGLNDTHRIVYFIGNERYEEVHPKYELLTCKTVAVLKSMTAY
jgi:integrase